MSQPQQPLRYWVFLFLFVLFPLPSLSSVVTCYLPSGEVAPNDQPCFPENPESSCCGGSTFICSTNNMCAYFDGSFYVIGSCTDPTWNSPACPGYCFFRDHVHNTVFRCAADTYCCDDGPTCNCTTGTNTQKIDDFLPPYSELVGSSVALMTTVATSSLFTPIGATRNAAATSSQTTTSTVTFTSTSLATSLTTGAPTAAAPKAGVGTNHGLQVGLGVGISLGVVTIALAVLAWVMWRRAIKNKKQASSDASQPYFLSNHAADIDPTAEAPSRYSGYKLYSQQHPPRDGSVFEAPGDEASQI